MLKPILPEVSDIQALQLKTKHNSLQFGRRLYSFQANNQNFWLKLQLQQGHPMYQQGFQRELEFYRQGQNATELTQITLPFKTLPKSALLEWGLANETELLFEQALIVPDAAAYFALDAQRQDISTIQHHFLRALTVVQLMHDAQWLHADLKREHFVEYAGQLKLIDFEQTQPMHALNQIAMNATPRYMAPELFHGDAKSEQTDIYALGIIFYEWLSGQRLSAENYQDWAYLHCQRLEIVLPEKFLVFQSLLSKMLAKHKAARFDNIYAIKRALVTEIA
ncbi:protein kinase domain-containing protein [Acinetobacter sp. GXMZU3951]